MFNKSVLILCLVAAIILPMLGSHIASASDVFVTGDFTNIVVTDSHGINTITEMTGPTISYGCLTSVSFDPFNFDHPFEIVSCDEIRTIWSVTSGGVVLGNVLDQDGDGFFVSSSGGTDCNDNDATIHPGATESFDNKDNDCNGVVDDGYVINSAGGQSSQVNAFLSYGNLPAKNLPVGQKTLPLNIQYGPTTNPATFKATLNGVDVTSLFHSSSGGRESVNVDLQTGRNVLILSISGMKSSGATSTDTDRLAFIVS